MLLRASPQILTASVALIYLIFPTKNYYWDGVRFASVIEGNDGSASLIHPHHLLYNSLGYGIYQLVQFFGVHVRALQVLQISNCILSALSAWLLFRILFRRLGSIYLSSILTLAFSFSATWWKYSTDADSYIPSILFLIVCLHLLIISKKPRPFSLALAHSASMFLHQLAVFFFPAIVVGILFQTTSLSLRDRVRKICEYSFTAAFVTIGVNYYCFHLQTGSFAFVQFARWLTSYVQGPESYSFSFALANNFRMSLRAQLRMFFEGRFNWTEGLLSWPIILLISTLVVFTIILAYRFCRALPSLRLKRPFNLKIDTSDRMLVGICLTWSSFYVVFLFFWYPYFTPYRIFSLPPLICLVAVMLKGRLDTFERKTNVAMFIAAMAISNFVFFIFPLTHVEKDPPLSFALRMQREFRRDSVVFYSAANADNQLVRYMNPAVEWRRFTGDPIEIERLLHDDNLNNQHSIWLETSAIDQIGQTAEGRNWLATHTDADRQQNLNQRGYRIELVPLRSTYFQRSE
jgi:hypothetical protein